MRRRVTPWELAGQEPAWSPDGTLIAFRSEPTDEEFIGDVYSVKPDGSDLTQLTKAKGKQVFSMSFSTDSAWIVFAMEGVGHLPEEIDCDADEAWTATRTSRPTHGATRPMVVDGERLTLEWLSDWSPGRRH